MVVTGIFGWAGFKLWPKRIEQASRTESGLTPDAVSHRDEF
jgi:hypothetical protein